jgi:hypothetical protein
MRSFIYLYYIYLELWIIFLSNSTTYFQGVSMSDNGCCKLEHTRRNLIFQKICHGCWSHSLSHQISWARSWQKKQHSTTKKAIQHCSILMPSHHHPNTVCLRQPTQDSVPSTSSSCIHEIQQQWMCWWYPIQQGGFKASTVFKPVRICLEYR